MTRRSWREARTGDQIDRERFAFNYWPKGGGFYRAVEIRLRLFGRQFVLTAQQHQRGA